MKGLSEIKLADGSKVSVKKEFRCTLPKDGDKRDAAYKWLRDNKLEDIIKNNIFVTFGRGEDDKAEQLLNLAAENGFQPQQKSDVAWMTLTALFRERIEAGLDMPSDVFNTWIKDKTKITRRNNGESIMSSEVVKKDTGSVALFGDDLQQKVLRT